MYFVVRIQSFEFFFHDEYFLREVFYEEGDEEKEYGKVASFNEDGTITINCCINGESVTVDAGNVSPPTVHDCRACFLGFKHDLDASGRIKEFEARIQHLQTLDVEVELTVRELANMHLLATHTCYMPEPLLGPNGAPSKTCGLRQLDRLHLFFSINAQMYPFSLDDQHLRQKQCGCIWGCSLQDLDFLVEHVSQRRKANKCRRDTLTRLSNERKANQITDEEMEQQINQLPEETDLSKCLEPVVEAGRLKWPRPDARQRALVRGFPHRFLPYIGKYREEATHVR